ncbi:putative quinol monooxygenase [Francisella frigiditurris]|uniref:Antibiotic biosynthesis monooxygenase family protein n=1 Tax=Francisella frigiditurris TaxID=1542390 RepID=A0A1J0KVU5_9GAMM|nr:putative quinol monooxygenase [Francisella frigiditurris]APC97726.1 antibiotic biosynthesis monooxygenase family protein [Francisella frigiditurris]
MSIIIIANIKAKSDKINFIKAELTKLIEPTMSEPGCLQYKLHQDNDNITHFLFYEEWKTRESWVEHLESEHIEKFRSATEGCIKEFTVNEMTLKS